MRRVFALLVSVALLIVSSVPMVAVAEICAQPAHDMAMDEVMQDEHDHQHDQHGMSHEMHQQNVNKHDDVKHEHGMALAGDWQKQVIECGCGCHRSIDSLPQLLAPHTVTVAQLLIEMSPAQILAQRSPALTADAPRIPVPPPQFS